MRRAAAIIWALLGCAAFVPGAAGSPGDLDSSFSSDGWLRTLEVRSSDNNYLPRGAEDVAVQHDGRIVAVGELIDGTSNWYFGAFGYLPNGELDPSFGEGGWVDTDFGSFEFPHAVALQPDGGIVVAGEGDCQYAMCFVLARYRPDGSLDPGFGEGGIVRSPFGLLHASHAFDVSIAPDGRIVAAGFVQKGGDGQDSSHFAVARYLPDGRLDPSFSRDGRATVDFGYGNDIAYAVAHQRRGRIVVAGHGTRNRYRTEDDFAFARFRRDGRLDRSFSGNGKRTVNFGGRRYDAAYGLAVRGRAIIATGSTVVAPERAPSVAVARLTWGGGLARGFGRRRVLPSPGGGIGRAVLAQADGRILVGGRAFTDTSQDASDWALLRFGRGGRLDRSLGGDGIVVTDFGTGADSARALAIHDGRILAAGMIYSQLGLARYLP
ncbi:MAG TPA: hypothetical protein VNP92_03905 [Actinophytocola sp.]|nr:hypothetical protein [Actinophytocola sp.]